MRPESSLSTARVGDLTWGKDRKRRVRVATALSVGEDREEREY